MYTELPEVRLRIGNEDRATGSGGAFEHRNPCTGESQGIIPLAGQEEVDAAVTKAQSAFEEWRRWKPEDRAAIIHKLGTLMQDNAEQFAHLAALDGGMPLSYGVDMARRAGGWMIYYAGWADKLDGQTLARYDTRNQYSYTTPEPYGVVGIIITWNGPVISLGMKVAPALAAGNCVVVKPAEITPFVPDLFARLVREAGFPDGVISVLPGSPQAGEALVRDPRVEKISFTGGPVSARAILTACAEQMKPAVLELGGKSANLIFPDVDVDAVCDTAVKFTFKVLAGQGCVLPMRILVHETIFDEVVDTLVDKTRQLKIGNPLDPSVDVGPLINIAACDRIMGMIERARASGTAKVILGGERCGGELAGQNYIEPTILIEADPTSEIATTEVFGPVVLLMSFKDEDEAVSLANATRYGLGAFIQTRDVARAHRIAERLKSGGVYVNGASVTPHYAPFGGLGLSGYGKEGGRAGIDEFLRYKTVSIA